jgi:AcrR family transcriptional regulator
VRERILDAFSQKAKRIGIRGVMMAQLASELRMSATTLYKQFPSKEALTIACVERWVDELAAAEAARPDPKAKRTGLDQFMHWLDAWSSANAELSPAFARDLQSDYPKAWKRMRKIAQDRSARGVALVRPLIRSEIDQRVALALLELIVTRVQRPEFAARLGISRKEAIRGALRVWATGAAKPRSARAGAHKSAARVARRKEAG